MKPIEELKADLAAATARKIAEAEQEWAIASQAVVPPRGVQLTSGGLAIWLSYEAAARGATDEWWPSYLAEL